LTSPSRTVTEADVVLFAGLSGDYHPAHTDEVYASKGPLVNKRVAHGLLVLSFSEGFFLRTNFFDWETEPLLSLGFDKVKFPKPVFMGDTIHSTFTVAQVRDSQSRPGHQIVVIKCECKNQRGETVCEYEHAIIVAKAKKED
jgi:acyl dehydratase